jgi:hypothetical protein
MCKDHDSSCAMGNKQVASQQDPVYRDLHLAVKIFHHLSFTCCKNNAAQKMFPEIKKIETERGCVLF